MVRKSLIVQLGYNELLEAPTMLGLVILETNSALAVKFDTEQLPEILNALETDNGGNKLILEVSVRSATISSKDQF